MITFDVLLSYAFHRKTKTDLRVLRKAIGPEALMLIDSGAFTAHTTGVKIEKEAYADYLREWEGVYDRAITLDVIGDPKATMANTRWLWDQGLPVLPVHTASATLAEFDAVCDDPDTDYLALGGLVSAFPGLARAARQKFVAALVWRARRSGVAVHVLGSAGHSLLRNAQPFSVDVSTPSRTLLYGIVSIYIDHMKRPEQIAANDVAKIRLHRQALADHGIRPTDMLSGTMFNEASTRRRVTGGAAIGLAVYGHEVRKIVQADPPARNAGRMVGPRVCNSLVTKENVEGILDLLDNGMVKKPIPRVLQRRLGEP